MIVSIHQPDFLPWLGFFSKIVNCDRFVVFDNVDAPQGKSWLTRNRILLKKEPYWITVPVHKGSSLPIRELRITTDNAFKRKHLGTIKQAYIKTKYYDLVFPILDDIYNLSFTHLADFNFAFIDRILRLLEIDTEILWATDLLKNNSSAQLKGNDMVLTLAKAAKAKKYLSGTGCTDFIRPEEFDKEGIRFVFQNFIHPNYTQIGNPVTFESHMSIIDALFNVGPKETLNFLRGAHDDLP